MLCQLSYCPMTRTAASGVTRQGLASYHHAGGPSLSSFLVRGVLAVPAAELLHLDTLTIIELVLHRDVVPSLALFAGQGHLNPLFVLSHRFLLNQPDTALSHLRPLRICLVAAAGVEPATPRL